MKLEGAACIQRKDFPRDFWNYHLNPITGERAKTVYIPRNTDFKSTFK